MIVTPPPPPSPWRLRWDLLWARVLLWLTQAERRGELRPEVNLFVADREARLAEDRHRHRRTNAERLAAARARLAALEADRDDDPPPACAMGLPRRRTSIAVEARGTVLPGRWPGASSR